VSPGGNQPRFLADDSALASLPREFRFHPSPVAHPATLTAGQVEAFNREGYLRGIRIFAGDEIAEIRRYFDLLLERTLKEGGDSYSISTAHLRYGRVYDLLTERRIVACVKDLIGENAIGWGSHFFCKMPGDGKRVSWHQDSAYWPLTPTKAVTAWLAIDDADRENACMRFIPRSHLLGHLTHGLSEADDANVLNRAVPGAEALGEPVDVELRAGEISIHSDLLLHGSEANTSQRRRCGLTLRYCPSDVRAGLGWNAKGVVVSGSEPSGHWANPPRPAAD